MRTRVSGRWLARGLVAVGLVVGMLTGIPHADAVLAPRTLAVSTPVGAAPVTPGFGQPSDSRPGRVVMLLVVDIGFGERWAAAR